MTALTVDPRLSQRRSAVADQAQRRRVQRLIALAGVVAVLLAGWGMSRSSLFDVEEVRWSGLDRTDLDVAAELAGVETGRSIASVDSGAIEARLEELPWVADAAVIRSWSGVVSLDVTERPAVALVMKAQDQWVMVDATGTVLSDEIAGSGLPRISGIPAAGEPGSVLGRSASAPLVVTSLLPATLAPRLEGIARDERGEMWLTLLTADRILLGDDTQLALKLAAVVTVLEAVDQSGRTGWEMDVSVPTLPVVRDLRPEWQDNVVVQSTPELPIG